MLQGLIRIVKDLIFLREKRVDLYRTPLPSTNRRNLYTADFTCTSCHVYEIIPTAYFRSNPSWLPTTLLLIGYIGSKDVINTSVSPQNY